MTLGSKMKPHSKTKYSELNDNETMMYKNLLGPAKAMVKVLKYKAYNGKE